MNDPTLIDIYPYWRRRKIYKRYMFRGECPVYCAYCASQLSYDKATVEHVVPRKGGGRDSYDNFLIACSPCNMAEGERTRRLYRGLYRHDRCIQCVEVHHKEPGDRSRCPLSKVIEG